jgi:hypothetical protein
VEWTKTFMSLILRHLDSVSKASADAIQKRVAKWRYLIRLSVEMVRLGLLFQPELLQNLLMLFQKSSLKQLPFMIPLLSPFTEEFSRSRYVIRQLTLICQQKLLLIKEQHSLSAFTRRIFEILMGMLKHLLWTSPDTFISIKLWSNYKSLREYSQVNSLDSDHVQCNSEWEQVEGKVEKRTQILFHSFSHISKPTSCILEYLSHFRMESDFELPMIKIVETDLIAGREIVFIVLDWARNGYTCAFTKYRVYAACRVLDRLFSGLGGLLSEYLEEYLQNRLKSDDELITTHFLYSTMHSYGIFSYFHYLRILVGNGFLEQSGAVLQQKQFLLDFGLRNDDYLTLLHLRVTLGIEDTRSDSKLGSISTIKKQIMEMAKTIFINDGKVYGDHSDVIFSDVDQCCLDSLSELKESLSKFSLDMKLIVSEWLKHSIFQHTIVALSSNVGSSALNCQQYATVCFIFELLEDYETLLEVNLWLFENSNDRWLYHTILLSLRKHRSIFSLMGADIMILSILFEKYESRKKQYIDQTTLHFLARWLNSTSIPGSEEFIRIVKDDQADLEVFFSNLETQSFQRCS